MEPDKFDALQKLIDKIVDILEVQLALPELHQVLAEMSKIAGKDLTTSLSVVVDVFSDQKKQALPLLSTGLSAPGHRAPYRTWGDSSPHRYVVKDGICVVPHDRCPCCWGEWDFKFKNLKCSHCQAELGKDCKLLLDSDQCPFCEEGKVTMANPRCTKCNFEVDTKTVAWG